jgi:recombination protein RecT
VSQNLPTNAKPQQQGQSGDSNLKSFLSSDSMKAQIKAALPSHVSVDKFVRILLTALSNNPQLAQADRNSLLVACMKCAQDGLLPDGRESALVTFKNNSKGIIEVQYLPMYEGILKKLRNSGELASIFAEVIYENDEFEEFVDEAGHHFKFKPNRFDDRGQVKGAFAVGKTKDGSVYIEIMSEKQIQAVKKVSRSANSSYSPWSGEFADEMRKKSVVRRLAKRMPKSTDVEQTLQHDNEDYQLASSSASTANQLTAPQASEAAQIAAPQTSQPEPKKASRAEKAMGLAQPKKAAQVQQPKAQPEPEPMPSGYEEFANEVGQASQDEPQFEIDNSEFEPDDMPM